MKKLADIALAVAYFAVVAIVAAGLYMGYLTPS